MSELHSGIEETLNLISGVKFMFNSNLYNYLEKKYGKHVVTVEEVAVELGMEVDDINEAIENGDINVKALGKKVLIPLASLVNFLLDQDSANKRSKHIDTKVKPEVTSYETIEIVEDDIDMSKGCVSFIKDSQLWIYQIDIGKTLGGKRIRKSRSFKTEEEARKALAIELKAINTNIEDKDKSKINGVTTVKEYLDYYLSLEFGRGTPRTREGYRYSASKIAEVLGEYKLKELDYQTIMIGLNKLKREYAQATLKKIFFVLRNSIKYAVEEEIISNNPMKRVVKPRSEKPKVDEYKAFTSEQISDIVNAAKSYPDLYPIIQVFLYTGMRPGELRALRWSNVDYNDKTIYIKEAATYEIENKEVGKRGKRRELISRTKSPYSVRKLNVPEEVIEALLNWRKYIDSNDEYKCARNSEFLFPNKNGNFLGQDVLGKRFKKFLKNEGFDRDGINFYRFRHTLCTTLIKSGIDIPTIQKIMGDNSIEIIMKIYTSINRKDIEEASKKVYEYLKFRKKL